jgi:hypothetical protein
MNTKWWSENLKERSRLEYLGIGKKIILEWILRKQGIDMRVILEWSL